LDKTSDLEEPKYGKGCTKADSVRGKNVVGGRRGGTMWARVGLGTNRREPRGDCETTGPAKWGAMKVWENGGVWTVQQRGGVGKEVSVRGGRGIDRKGWSEGNGVGGEKIGRFKGRGRGQTGGGGRTEVGKKKEKNVAWGAMKQGKNGTVAGRVIANHRGERNNKM